MFRQSKFRCVRYMQLSGNTAPRPSTSLHFLASPSDVALSASGGFFLDAPLLGEVPLHFEVALDHLPQPVHGDEPQEADGDLACDVVPLVRPEHVHGSSRVVGRPCDVDARIDRFNEGSPAKEAWEEVFTIEKRAS